MTGRLPAAELLPIGRLPIGRLPAGRLLTRRRAVDYGRLSASLCRCG